MHVSIKILTQKEQLRELQDDIFHYHRHHHNHRIVFFYFLNQLMLQQSVPRLVRFYLNPER